MSKREWEVGAFKPEKVDNKPIEFLTQLAKDIVGNLVFTSSHLSDRSLDLLPSIFMPIIFGCFSEQSEEYRKDIGMIYEYYSEAGPRAINGYPIFTSLQYISLHDSKIVWEKVAKIEAMMKEI